METTIHTTADTQKGDQRASQTRVHCRFSLSISSLFIAPIHVFERLHTHTRTHARTHARTQNVKPWSLKRRNRRQVHTPILISPSEIGSCVGFVWTVRSGVNEMHDV